MGRRAGDVGTPFAFLGAVAAAASWAGAGENPNPLSQRIMNVTAETIASPKHLVDLAVRHPRRWLIPAVAVAALAGVYALARPATWEASQTLVIRNDAANREESLGKFLQLDEMKTLQETILELAKSRGVLAAALVEVGPPARGRSGQGAWPGELDVEALREALALSPPKGAEFGKTEVFYVKVRDQDRGRAVALASALCAQIEAGLQQLRDAKAASMAGELEKAAELAAKDLRESTARLSDMERRVGSDLAELRILHDATAGESALRRTITEIRNELRQVRAAEKSSEELLALLRLAQARPDRLVAMPNALLESQPGLRRLKEGLVDAQLSTSQLLGRMSAEHPLVKAANASQEEIARHVHDEVANAIRAVEVDLRLSAERSGLLEEQLSAANGRLDTLAALRAPYANQVAETRKRSDLWERAQQRLADARAAQATAHAASLIARIDSPDTGSRPVGPGRATIVLVGLLGGLLTGLGVLVLSIEPLPRHAGPVASLATAAAARPARSNGKPNGRPLPVDHDLTFTEAMERLSPVQPHKN